MLEYIPIVVIGGVVNSSDGAIGFDEGVLSLDYISVSGFPLGFAVTGVVISYSIVEFVFGVRL